jgi:hypothetical protein
MLEFCAQFKIRDSKALIVKVESITIRTHCVRCGDQIEKEVKVYKGKDFLNRKWLDKEDVHPDDSYTFIHLLCEKCDMITGLQNESEKK